MEKLRNTLSGFDTSTENQKMFKQTLYAHLHCTADYDDKECIENILMDFDTEFVFNIQTLKGPKILHRILYQYLELKGIKFDVERNGESILSNLAVVKADDKDMLTHIFTNIDIHRRFNDVSNPVDKKDQPIVLE